MTIFRRYLHHEGGDCEKSCYGQFFTCPKQLQIGSIKIEPNPGLNALSLMLWIDP